MDRLGIKRTRLKRRVQRVRYGIRSRNPRPRLVFVRSNRYLSAQVIDDLKGATICAATTAGKGFAGSSRKNKDAAKQLGGMLAERALAKGIKQVVLDRRGRLFHGRVGVFADAAREKGLEF